MAIWQKCNPEGTAPGARVDIDSGGTHYIKILSPSFGGTDGNGPYGRVCFGSKLIKAS